MKKRKDTPNFGDFLDAARQSRLSEGNYTTNPSTETEIADSVIVKKGHSSMPTPRGMKAPVSTTTDKELIGIAASVLGDDLESLLKQHNEGTW